MFIKGICLHAQECMLKIFEGFYVINAISHFSSFVETSEQTLLGDANIYRKKNTDVNQMQHW